MILHANIKRMTHSNNREFANAAPPYLTDRDMFRKSGGFLERRSAFGVVDSEPAVGRAERDRDIARDGQNAGNGFALALGLGQQRRV